MAWSHLAINSTNATCMFLGAFTSLFMLSSYFLKDKLAFGEANVAFIAGIIFGPRAANIFDPLTWNDSVILECTRVVLVVQCFALAVELPKRYIERHWKSLLYVLVPVMLWGWILSSLCVWFMARTLTWKECMACASCFNAIDPVLAATVIGRGHFGKRIPKHLRQLALAESGFNGITTTLVFGLSMQILQHSSNPRQLTYRLFVITTLYEVLFGAVAGLIVGRGAYKALRVCHHMDLIDRPSFLAFYLALALFCAGLGSLLGVDEVLLGFCAGYAFDRNDWFQELTKDSQLSTVIDLLLNLSFFVLLGAIVPWHMYNAPALRLIPWRLILGVILIFAFRRIPIILLLKPVIPDIKTWREALFYGHFGPIGAGSIFSALLVKAQLSSGGVSAINGSQSDHLNATIWPIVTFVVVCSSIFHGSSVPVFILGRRINTLTLTISYSQDNETGPSWLDRLPKIASQPRLSMDPSTTSRTSRFNKLKAQEAKAPRRRIPAVAYQFGHTIIVEDEAGEVVKQYSLPAAENRNEGASTQRGLGRLPSESGAGNESATIDPTAVTRTGEVDTDADSDSILNATVNMSTGDFVWQMQRLYPAAGIQNVNENDLPNDLEVEVQENTALQAHATEKDNESSGSRISKGKGKARLEAILETDDKVPKHHHGSDTTNANANEDIPMNDLSPDLLARRSEGSTAAEPSRLTNTPVHQSGSDNETEWDETLPEKRRRLAALGLLGGDSDDESSSDDEDLDAPRRRRDDQHVPVPVPEPEPSSPRAGMRVQWGAGGEGERRGQGEGGSGSERRRGGGGFRGVFGIGKRAPGA